MSSTTIPDRPAADGESEPGIAGFIAIWTILLIWLGIDLGLQFQHGVTRFTLLTAYLIPLYCAIALLVTARLAQQGPSPIPRVPALMGIAFIIGGAAADILATVTISPDLSLEGNPYLRALLDSQHSLAFVYWHSALAQAVYVSAFCLFWAAFLKHRTQLLEKIEATRPRSRFAFLKAATGGGQLSYRQWLFPIRWSELPELYPCVWVIVVVITFAISLFRWYAAMEWLEVVPISSSNRVFVIGGGTFFVFVLYLLLLQRSHRSREA